MLNFKNIRTKKLVFASLALAIALTTSYIRIFRMPMGGSITLMSMLFVCLVGYWYGPKFGVASGIAFGLLQLIIDPYILSVPQAIIDYVLSTGALGISGFFSNRRYGLQLGYVSGVFGRFVFTTLSGLIFFSYYFPQGVNPVLYSVIYNGIYIGAEAAITLIVISCAPVAKAMKIIKDMATSQGA